MGKESFFSKVGRAPIARLSTPKGGIFSGRVIPKERLNDPYWLRVLELEKPPEDGLYVLRSSISPQDDAKKASGDGTGKSLPVRALYGLVKAVVEYEQSAAQVKKGNKKPRKTRPEPFASIPKRAVTTTSSPNDWNEISPDFEADRLGLEQLGQGESLSIVGAGISGLTLAWILNRARPDIKIDVYDKNTKVGGWMGSKKIELPNGSGYVTFESGPRTLLPSHPGSEILARILHEIGVRDTLMGGVPRAATTNQKALVYNEKIQKLPRSLGETIRFLLGGPLLRGAKFQAFKDFWVKARPPTVHDESVRSFVTRRLGKPMADRMISAVMRGIYAADIDKLSARSVARMNRMYYLEGTEQMSIIGSALSGSLGYLEQYTKFGLPVIFDSLVPPTVENRQLVNKEHRVPKFSLYGFKEGIQGMAETIAQDLRKRKNVEIHLGQGVKSVEPYKASQVRVHLGDGSVVSTNVLVSTIAQPSIFEKSAVRAADEMKKIKYSSLAVVNIWVPDPQYAKDWFGILVPKTEDDWNSEGILGIIFDSSVRNASIADKSQHEQGSNMTVMLGGDLWTEMDEAEAKRRALAGIQKVLGPLDEAQAITHVALQRNAIPLYEVGHSVKQQTIHSELSRAYAGRVALIGMAAGRGVGVSDCVVDAMTVALRFSEQRKLLHPAFFFNHWLLMTRPNMYV